MAKTPTQASADARPEPPIMKSHCLTWQHQGHAWRDAFVSLPVGMLFQDVQDVPGIWKNIQQVPQTALQRFDRVTAVSHCGTWMIRDAIVIDASVTGAVLAIRPTDRITLPGKPAQPSKPAEAA